MTQKDELDWPRLARWAVALGLVFFGMTTPLDNTDAGGAVEVGVAFAAFCLLKAKAEREERRRTDAAALRESVGR